MLYFVSFTNASTNTVSLTLYFNFALLFLVVVVLMVISRKKHYAERLASALLSQGSLLLSLLFSFEVFHSCFSNILHQDHFNYPYFVNCTSLVAMAVALPGLQIYVIKTH